VFFNTVIVALAPNEQGLAAGGGIAKVWTRAKYVVSHKVSYELHPRLWQTQVVRSAFSLGIVSFFKIQ